MKKINSMMSYGLWISVLLFVSLSINAQPQQYNTAMQPQATFQSTSTMQGSGSKYAAQPMLNANGMATNPNSTSGGPRRAKLDGPATPGTPFTPGQGEAGNQFPLGDAMWPLLLMALAYAAYCAVRVYRRKRRV